MNCIAKLSNILSPFFTGMYNGNWQCMDSTGCGILCPFGRLCHPLECVRQSPVVWTCTSVTFGLHCAMLSFVVLRCKFCILLSGASAVVLFLPPWFAVVQCPVQQLVQRPIAQCAVQIVQCAVVLVVLHHICWSWMGLIGCLGDSQPAPTSPLQEGITYRQGRHNHEVEIQMT